MLGLIANDLRRNHQQLVADLCDEMREDYLLSVKKAIVDFVLRDSSRDNVVLTDAKAAAARAAKLTPQHRLEIAIVPKPWHNSFERNRVEIQKNLFAINPCMAQVLKLWYPNYNKLRMIDINEFRSMKNAIDLPFFLNSCMKNIEYAKDQLAKK